MPRNTIKPITLKLDPPKQRRFYNLYARYSDVYKRFHGLSEITRDTKFNDMRIYTDLEASSLTQSLIDTWTKSKLFPFKNTWRPNGRRMGQIVIAKDAGEISGLALQSAVETIIANGIEAVINAKTVFDSQEKNPQIECYSSTFQEFYNFLISRNKIGLSLQGMFINSEDSDKHAFFQILNGNGSFVDINDFIIRKDVKRISFDAVISGHNPDPRNSGRIEIMDFALAKTPQTSNI